MATETTESLGITRRDVLKDSQKQQETVNEIRKKINKGNKIDISQPEEAKKASLAWLDRLVSPAVKASILTELGIDEQTSAVNFQEAVRKKGITDGVIGPRAIEKMEIEYNILNKVDNYFDNYQKETDIQNKKNESAFFERDSGNNPLLTHLSDGNESNATTPTSTLTPIPSISIPHATVPESNPVTAAPSATATAPTSTETPQSLKQNIPSNHPHKQFIEQALNNKQSLLLSNGVASVTLGSSIEKSATRRIQPYDTFSLVFTFNNGGKRILPITMKSWNKSSGDISDVIDMAFDQGKKQTMRLENIKNSDDPIKKEILSEIMIQKAFQDLSNQYTYPEQEEAFNRRVNAELGQARDYIKNLDKIFSSTLFDEGKLGTYKRDYAQKRAKEAARDKAESERRSRENKEGLKEAGLKEWTPLVVREGLQKVLNNDQYLIGGKQIKSIDVTQGNTANPLTRSLSTEKVKINNNLVNSRSFILKLTLADNTQKTIDVGADLGWNSGPLDKQNLVRWFEDTWLPKFKIAINE